MAGPCTCGLFHNQSNSFSMLFSMPNHKPFDETDMYPFTSSSSSSVDCTLSLGTPSTRLTDNDEKRMHHDRRAGSCVSNFCWDILHSGSSSNNSAGDPLLARRCANCDTTSTPLWRNGPRGPKSLCNACGIRFKKEERRATAAAATTGATAGVMEPQHIMISHHNNSWVHHSQTQKMPCLSPAMGNEFRFIEDDDRDSDTGIPFLSWPFELEFTLPGLKLLALFIFLNYITEQRSQHISFW
uniref:GATA-type domain-containing protein n=1 Tax=Vitis vinifera TaxID=29760 RepID=F6GWW1_VITVI